MERQIIFYDDGTQESRKVEETLRKEGVGFTEVPCSRVQGKTPAIGSQSFLFEGLEEIRNYFLPELDESLEE